MKQYLLGIDIGTSSCKAAVFDRAGNALAFSTKSYPTERPLPGYAQQNPEDWWKAACEAVRECLDNGKVSPGQIAGIGVDGQSWSAVPIGRSGEVLADSPIWLDTRSEEICAFYNRRIGEKRIFAAAGNLLQPFYSTGKVLWFREYRPEIYKKTEQFLQSNSYLVLKLTGLCSQDLSQAYGYHWFHMEKGTWDEEMCRAFQIPMNFLPKISRCTDIIGTVTEKAAAECGLIPGIPVAAGGLDAACGALGAGVIHHGETQEQGGQAGGMSILSDRYCAEPSLILSRHVTGNQWLLQGGTTGGGGLMRWVEQEFAEEERQKGRTVGKSSLDLLNEEAGGIPPGSAGVVFLPYMAGERTPIWNPGAKGVIYGLDYSKTKAHLVRAAMEGVAFSLRHNLEAARKAGAEAGVLRSVGGAANSPLWMQIKADVTGNEIQVPGSDMAATLGAAMLAGVGTGYYKNFEEAVKQTCSVKRSYRPDEANKEIYDSNYKIYLDLYRQLKPVMNGGKDESSCSMCQ